MNENAEHAPTQQQSAPERVADSCPCCGALPQILEDYKCFRDGAGWQLRCDNCGLQTCWWHTKEEAYQRWNTRVRADVGTCWQPIETAPEDGSELWLALRGLEGWIYAQGHWYPDDRFEAGGDWYFLGGAYMGVLPSYWKHLPASPDARSTVAGPTEDMVSREAVNKILYNGYQQHLHECTNSVRAAEFIHGLQKAVTALPTTIATPTPSTVAGDFAARLWEALKQECCKVPVEARMIVFLSEKKFRTAVEHVVGPREDALVDEVQHRMDQVVEAAVEWHQSDGQQDWLDKAQVLGDAINSLLELRDKPTANQQSVGERCVDECDIYDAVAAFRVKDGNCVLCGHLDLDADGLTCAAPVPICSDDSHGLRHCGCHCVFPSAPEASAGERMTQSEWFVSGGNGFYSIYEQGAREPVLGILANDTSFQFVSDVVARHNAAITKAQAATVESICDKIETLTGEWEVTGDYGNKPEYGHMVRTANLICEMLRQPAARGVK